MRDAFSRLPQNPAIADIRTLGMIAAVEFTKNKGIIIINGGFELIDLSKNSIYELSDVNVLDIDDAALLDNGYPVAQFLYFAQNMG